MHETITNDDIALLNLSKIQILVHTYWNPYNIVKMRIYQNSNTYIINPHTSWVHNTKLNSHL